MVLIHESPEDGWWEAVVIQRESEILTLRFRDYPRLPTVVRHISTVALVNPGPAVQAPEAKLAGPGFGPHLLSSR
jgi:hypothetical protein